MEESPLSQGAAAQRPGVWMSIAGPKVCEANLWAFYWRSQ